MSIIRINYLVWFLDLHQVLANIGNKAKPTTAEIAANGKQTYEIIHHILTLFGYIILYHT